MSLEIHGILISLLVSIALPSLVAVIFHRKEINKLDAKINELEKLIKGENK